MLIFTPSLLFAFLLPSIVSADSFPQTSAAAAIALPACVQECGIKILTAFQCMPQDPCYCNDVQLSKALTGCVMSTCEFGDQLKAAKFRADGCGHPIRNRSRPTKLSAPILFAAAIAFVIARMLSRCPALSGAGYKADDYLVLLLVIPTVAMFVVSHYTFKNGSGQDVWELSPDKVITYMKWFLTGQVAYFMVVFGTKLSLALLYLRIWPPFDGRTFFHWTCYAVAMMLVYAVVVSCTTVTMACRPIAAYWDLRLRPQASCLDSTKLHYGFATVNLTLDLVLLIIPIPKILRLRISLPRKLGLLATFAVGGLVTACSVVRIYFLKLTAYTTNPTYDFAPAGLLGVIELNASIITCCMPATAGLARRIWGKGIQPLWSSLHSLRSTSNRTPSNSSAADSTSSWNIEKTHDGTHIRPPLPIPMPYRAASN
ncbi:hypothetical protein CERZMDRAFT_116205 [Cercospora zeae-maydis SCOH1-5]|uniref:CFEM domain-containing protein n=1 Tax=Cercospora zeae-maydis SCOH1-5 TaxID=717836 RepID=A0A6A6FU32_9PEZI|nr:hypothetical protein CERZMDRAFT_116205 [Cercospora zeae-maydis SCOH1-5]